MNIAPLNATLRTPEEIPVEKLASHQGLTESEKVAEASRQFEAVLLRQILHDARKPVFKSTLTEQSASNSIYDDMITAQLADSISRSGEFGLARSLATQLKPGESTPNSGPNHTPHPSSSPS